MKHLVFNLILATILLVSCNKDDSESQARQVCTEVTYGQVFEMIIDDAVCLPDGNEIVLKVIEDQFCPCDHLCIWQGELQIMLEVANSAGEKRLVSVGSESFDVTDPIFENTKTASYTY